MKGYGNIEDFLALIIDASSMMSHEGLGILWTSSSGYHLDIVVVRCVYIHIQCKTPSINAVRLIG
jgi:hypothetical protein